MKCSAHERKLEFGNNLVMWDDGEAKARIISRSLAWMNGKIVVLETESEILKRERRYGKCARFWFENY